MNKVAGCAAIIPAPSHASAHPLCQGPSRPVPRRMQGSPPWAATGPDGAGGLAGRAAADTGTAAAAATAAGVRLGLGNAGRPPAEGDDPDDGLADSRCDDEALRRDLVAAGAEPGLPGPRHRTGPLDCDRVPYRARKGVARSMGWLQQGRPIAAHHEKTAARDPGCVRCAAARQGRRNPLANVHRT